MNSITEHSKFSTAPQSKWLEIHPSLGISLMDHLFNRLDGAYPNRWRASFQNDMAIKNWRESWAEVFEEEGLTFDQVKAGLAKCRREYDWPPSVAEFVKACKPAMNIEAALYEAREQMANRRSGTDKWTNPAYYWAAVRIGEFDMVNHSHAQLLPRFKAALEAVLEAGNVRSVPVRAPEALPAPGKTVAKPERVAEEMSKMRAMTQAVGNKDWAHRIIARHKTGEKIAYMTLKMAKSAITGNFNGNLPMENAA